MRSIVAIVAVAGCGRIGFAPAAGVRAGTDGDVTDCRALGASWAPAWAQLVAYLPLDGSGSIADGAAVPATVGDPSTASNANGTGLAYVPGKLGQAATFDGVDDYLTLPLPAIDTGSGDAVSVAFWMRWNGVFYPGNDSGWTAVINFNGVYELTLTPDGSSGEFGFNTGNGDIWGVATTTGLANQWVHVVGVFANGPSDQSQLYLDGELQDATQVEGASHVSAVQASVEIAAYPSYPKFFGGQLDELAVWNTALSTADVSAIYGAQLDCMD